MGNEPTVTVSIGANGETKMVFGNTEGSECLDIAKELESKLNADMKTIEYTADFYKKGKPRAVIIRQGN
jgi:hypothetical protein